MPTPLRTLAALVSLLAVTAPLRAQTRPAAPFDVEPLLARLNNPATHDAAAKSIPTLPASALGPLYEAWKDPTLSLAARDALDENLPALHLRIIQDRRKISDARAVVEMHASGIDTYEKFGQHDPKWDDSVKAMFKAIDDKSPTLLEAAKAAIDAGCDDPLVRYYYASRASSDDLPIAERLKMLAQAAKDLGESHYASNRQMYADLKYLLFSEDSGAAAAIRQLTPKNKTLVLARQKVYDEVLRLLPSCADDLSPEMVAETLSIIQTANRSLGTGKGDALFKTTYESLKKALPNNPYVETFAAQVYVDSAWDARGSGWASTVTPQGWQDFTARIEEAEKHVTASVEDDPANSAGPTIMLTICMATSADRNTLNYWFARAVNGDRDNTDAARRAIYALLPKWGGSEKDTLDFARSLVEKYSGRMPLMLVEARELLADDSGDTVAYMQQPDTWADIQIAYEKVLADESHRPATDPELRADRAHYLKYAANCQQWADFNTLAAKFGDDLDMSVFGGQALFSFFKKKAAAAAANH